MHTETARMVIRDFLMEDADDLQEILGDAETMRHCEPVYTPGKTADFLRTFCIEKRGALAAVHKETGKVIGYILFHSYEEGAYEIGWLFNRAFWRQGFASEACRAVIGYAFEEKNVRKVFAETIDAEKSVPLMKKLGMKLEEIQQGQTTDPSGNRADLHIYSILSEDWQGNKI